MSNERKEQRTDGSGRERELRGGTGGMGLDFKLAGRWGKHKTDILSDIKLFRAFCLKLAGVVFIDLTHPSQRLKLSQTKIHNTIETRTD